MPTILSYAAVQGATPTRASLEVLTRARELAQAGGHDLAAVVVAPDSAAAADALAAYGAQTVYAVSDAAFEQHLNAPLVAALQAVIETAQPALVLFPSSEGVKDVLGALAVRVGAAVLPDVTEVDWADDGAVTALRPVMASKFMSRVRAQGTPVLVSVRSGSYEASEAPVEARVEAVPFAPADAAAATLREIVGAVAGGVDLADARVVVAAGRGVKDDAAKALVEELAEVLGAAIGASRAVVESGAFPATAQIGQTGKVVSPDLYIGVGISGAIQHVAGMVGSRTIVAINSNPDAPIFDVATYGIVGDLYAVLPPLIEQIRAAKA